MAFTISVLTLVHKRKEHLTNLVRGLGVSQVVPDELIIVHMNEPAYDDLPAVGCPVRVVHVGWEATRWLRAFVGVYVFFDGRLEVVSWFWLACVHFPRFLLAKAQRRKGREEERVR